MTDPKVTKLKIAETGEEPAADGRRQRSERSKQKIVDAMMVLIRAGNMAPSAAKVADEAGVGLRTVFRHFEDMDALFSEMDSRVSEEVFPKLFAPFEATKWQDRLVELVTRRADLYEQIFPFKVSGGLKRFQSDFLMANHRRFLQMGHSSLEAILPKSVSENAGLFSALLTATSFDTWRQLRQDQGLSVEDAEAVVKLSVKRLIA